jgi:hypothetical protein
VFFQCIMCAGILDYVGFFENPLLVEYLFTCYGKGLCLDILEW